MFLNQLLDLLAENKLQLMHTTGCPTKFATNLGTDHNQISPLLLVVIEDYIKFRNFSIYENLLLQIYQFFNN